MEPTLKQTACKRHAFVPKAVRYVYLSNSAHMLSSPPILHTIHTQAKHGEMGSTPMQPSNGPTFYSLPRLPSLRAVRELGSEKENWPEWKKKWEGITRNCSTTTVKKVGSLQSVGKVAREDNDPHFMYPWTYRKIRKEKNDPTSLSYFLLFRSLLPSPFLLLHLPPVPIFFSDGCRLSIFFLLFCHCLLHGPPSFLS